MNTQSVAVAPTVRTTYAVIVTNDKGCSASDNIVVSVVGCKDETFADVTPSPPTPLPEGEGSFLAVYPNPFSESATVSYSIVESSNVEIGVYDLLGNRVVVLVNEKINIVGTSREMSLQWNRKDLGAGIYFMEMNAGDARIVKKVVVY